LISRLRSIFELSLLPFPVVQKISRY